MKPVVRVDIAELDDPAADTVADRLDDLGLTGEELHGHLGTADELAQMLVFSADSLRSVFDAMLAAAGGAAAAKLGDLLLRLAKRGRDSALEDRNGQTAVVVDEPALTDPRAMEALLHVDPAAWRERTVLVWDPDTARWRPQS